MKRLLSALHTLIRVYQGLRTNSGDSYQQDQKARRRKAKDMLTTVSLEARTRFDDEVLTNLLDAGWHENRDWGAQQLAEFEGRFQINSPSKAHDVLKEFGGLDIGLTGRTVDVAQICARLCAARQTIGVIVGSTLYPVGQTNIFEDDGLGVYLDKEGRVFVDGATGHEPPNDYRVELIASTFDHFLHRLFSPTLITPLASWDYTETDIVHAPEE